MHEAADTLCIFPLLLRGAAVAPACVHIQLLCSFVHRVLALCDLLSSGSAGSAGARGWIAARSPVRVLADGRVLNSSLYMALPALLCGAGCQGL